MLETYLAKSLALLKTVKEENQKRKLQDGQDHYETTVEDQIRREFEQQQRDDLSQAAKHQLIEELKDEMRPRVVDTLIEVLRDQIKAELRPKVEAELRSKLEAELRPRIEEELRKEVHAKLEGERTAAPNNPDTTSHRQSIDAAGAKSDEEPGAYVAGPHGPKQQTATKQAIANEVFSLREEELGRAPTSTPLPPTEDDLPDYEYYEHEEEARLANPSSLPVDVSLFLSSIEDEEILPSIETPDPPFQPRALAPPSGDTTEEDDDDDEHWERKLAASAENYAEPPRYGTPPARADSDDLLGSCREKAIMLDSDDDEDDDELPRGRKRGWSGEEEEEEMEGGWKRQRMVGEGLGEGRWEEEFGAEETLVGWASPWWGGAEE